MNHAPTEIIPSRLDLSENLIVGDSVLSFTTLDSDADDQFVYSLPQVLVHVTTCLLLKKST